MERLPPNQTLTKKFPVVGEKDPGLEIDIAEWRLEVTGEVEEPASFTYGEILAIPQQQREADIHCVTGWSRYNTVFAGFPLNELLGRRVRVNCAAKFVRFVAYSARNHDVSLPLDVAMEDSWLVHSADGEPLSVSRGYPLRVLTPSKYLYKSLKWVRRLELLADDRLGFWERTSGYHNNADPWQEQRLSAHRFTSTKEADAFRALTDFSAYRGEHAPVIVKANLDRWSPRTKNLRGLRLKACTFDGADLSGCDFSGANLTLSKLAGANLEGADFSGADLEGADFSGARLANATFADNFMSATTFNGRGGLASYEGMKVLRPDGLLESQAEYLRGLGIVLRWQ